MLERMQRLVDEWSAKLAWLPPLLVRVGLGIAFTLNGWGKLHNLSGIVEFFTSLGIPAPQVMAPLVAGTEFVGGLMLLLGLGTRIAALALASTMVVAMITKVFPDLDDKIGIFATLELAYLGIFIWLAVAGPGPVSVDHILRKSMARPPSR